LRALACLYLWSCTICSSPSGIIIRSTPSAPAAPMRLFGLRRAPPTRTWTGTVACRLFHPLRLEHACNYSAIAIVAYYTPPRNCRVPPRAALLTTSNSRALPVALLRGIRYAIARHAHHTRAAWAFLPLRVSGASAFRRAAGADTFHMVWWLGPCVGTFAAGGFSHRWLPARAFNSDGNRHWCRAGRLLFAYYSLF